MWGTIDNKKISNIKESYCLGEACLIFEYGKEAQRTVAFSKNYDLKKALQFIKSNDKNFIAEKVGREIHITHNGVKFIISLVNISHADRFLEVLNNYKK